MRLNKKKQEHYIRLLTENSLLKGLKEDRIRSLMNQLDEENWPKHSCNISRKKMVTRVHFILSGRLKIYKVDPVTGRELTLFLLTKNDVFDILCLLDNQEHEVHYETLDKLELLSTSMEVMREWIRLYPEINKNLLPYLGRRMVLLEEYATNLTLADISTRLAKLILTNINSSSRKLELINDLSNEELANLIGTTRAVVNRHLQEFREDGILNLNRKNMEIKDLQRLLEKIASRQQDTI